MGLKKLITVKKPVYFLLLLFVVAGCTHKCARSETDATEYRVTGTLIVVEDPGGMPALCWAGNGDLLLAYATNWQPIPPAGGTIKLMRSTDKGRRWSEPYIIVHPKNSDQWSTHIWSGLHLMPDNSLIMAYGQNFSEDSAEAYIMRSADHGKTWDKPVRVAKEEVVWNGEKITPPYVEGFGKPVTTRNGDVLVPIGIRFGDGGWLGTKASAFIRSSDNGKSWQALEFIVTGNMKFSETTFVAAANGNIIANIRCDTDRRVLYQSISHDNGNTWEEVKKTAASGEARDYIQGKMPDMLTLPSGRIIMGVGSVDVMDGSEVWAGGPGASYSGLYISDDYGVTWQRDVLFVSADPENLIPYDSPQLVQRENGDILALSVQMDRRSKDKPESGYTGGAHYVINVIRNSK